MELNIIPSKGKFGTIATQLNRNFDILQVGMSELQFSVSKNKGMFVDDTALETTIPSPLVGDWALVGSDFPCAIYICETAGVWVDSGETYDGDNVNLNNYLNINDFNVYKSNTQVDINNLKEENAIQPNIENGGCDFEITDKYGNAIVKFENGHVKTKNFDSQKANIEIVDFENDFDIRDESGNIIVKFAQGHIFTKNFNSKELKASKKIKILSIGNSFSYDAFSYLPPLLEDMIDADVTFGILYTASSSLADQYNNLYNNTAYTDYSLYKTVNGAWENNPISSLPNTVLASEDWDIIVLQQVSTLSNDYTTYQPYIYNIIDILASKTNNAKIGWLLTPSRVVADMDEFYEGIVECVTNLLDDTIIDFVLPCGTAVHNARHTTLDYLGDGGHLTYDQAHLQEGLPCLIESYSAALKLCEVLGYGSIGILGNQIRPNASWAIQKNILNKQGLPVGLNDSNVLLGAKCAIWSIKKPYEITLNIY